MFGKSQLTALVFGVLVFSFSSKFGAEAAERRPELVGNIESYLTAAAENGFSGAMLIAIRGEIVLNRGYGMADRAKNIANSSNTVFDIGSNTKQFTGAAILKLEELGKLKISDRLAKYFDDLPVDKSKITLHQLLTHSSGIIDRIGNDFDVISEKKYFKELFATDLLHQPGTKYKYSNAGYSILAKVIQIASGQTYEAFLTEHLFGPAGMKRSGYLIPNWDDKMLARGYRRHFIDWGSSVARYRIIGATPWHLIGNGGINSTQNDMFKWHQALKSNLVLSRTSLEKLITPYIGRENGAFKYGYGWAVTTTTRNTKRIHHNGSNGRFSHSYIWWPNEDVVIIYATNAKSRETEDLAHTVADMMFEDGFQPVPVRKSPFNMVADFIENHTPTSAGKLLALIEANYGQDFEDADILNYTGYVLLGEIEGGSWALNTEEQHAWAIALFEMNSLLFPDDWNSWDSLGDGYVATGQLAKAIKSYKRAVELGSTVTGERLAKLLKQEKSVKQTAQYD